MYDKELVTEILSQILHASLTAMSRFEAISEVSDFTGSPSGIEKMDSVCCSSLLSVRQSRSSTR